MATPRKPAEERLRYPMVQQDGSVRCSCCGQTLAADLFYVKPSGHYYQWCKPCRAEAQRRRRQSLRLVVAPAVSQQA